MTRQERRLVTLVREIAALEAIANPDDRTVTTLNVKRGMLAQVEAIIASGRA